MIELYSLRYFLVVLLIFILHWLLPSKYRSFVLLCASLFVYYLFEKENVLVLIWIGAISFAVIHLIRRKRNKFILVVGSAVVLLPLFILKYFNTLLACLETIVSLNAVSLELLAPIGISYYTFEAISSMADAYRMEKYEVPGFIDHLCYLTYFPTVMSGPIERSGSFIKQLNTERQFNCNDALMASRKIVIGLFKKIVIADHLALCVNTVFNDVHSSYGFALAIAVFCYTFQIYCDFSGYSEIASGLSGLFGIGINENFRRPYLATTIKEFWSRWHISLSQWLRDYIYIPLGGNRKGRYRKYLNLVITFLVSAAWHGPKLVNIVWGSFHAAMEIFEDLFHIGKDTSGSHGKTMRIILMFVLISISWVIFRSDSLSDLFYMLDPANYLRGLAGSGLISYLNKGMADTGLSIWLVLLIVIQIVTDLAYEEGKLSLGDNGKVLTYAMYFLMIIMIMAFASTEGVSFVYFKY